MKIYTVEITIVNGTSAQAIYERADFDTALSAYHNFMSSAMANKNCTKAVCMVINEDGGIYKNDAWVRTAE